MDTDFFCVACSGPTVDGRNIKPEWIDQMAATYDPAVYGARIWLEHCRGLLPEASNPFAAYGDVIAVKAVDGADGKRELHAKISPTPELMKINQARQKVYWSIELTPNFAETGKAYLTGLAITDSPASLGTDALKFTAATPIPETLMSQPVPVAATPAVASPSASPPATDGESKTETSLLAKISALFSKSETAAETAATTAATAATAAAETVKLAEKDRADHDAALLLMAETIKAYGTSVDELQKNFTAASAQIAALMEKFNQALADQSPSVPTTAPVAGATAGVDY